MNVSKTQLSPITLTEAVFENAFFEGGWKVIHKQPPVEFYVNRLVEQLNPSSKYSNSTGDSYAPHQVRAGWDLIRSKVYAAHLNKGKPIFVVTEFTYASVDHEQPPARDFIVLSLEREIQEAIRLSFLEKAHRTLDILVYEWEQDPSQPITTPSMGIGTNAVDILFKTDCKDLDWRCYASSPALCPLIFQHLLDEKHLVPYLVTGRTHGMKLSPRGLQAVEQLRRGRLTDSHLVFFIRPWDEEFDTFFLPLVARIESEAGCSIKAVWDEPHNEKIDERILRIISSSAVILLLIDPERFNVGFEAGYALALNKPIIAFRRKPAEDAPNRQREIPFDIRTMNVYDYKPRRSRRPCQETFRAHNRRVRRDKT